MAVFLDNGMKSSIQEGQVQGDLLQEADLEGTLLRGGEEPGTWDVLPDCLSRLVFELKVGGVVDGLARDAELPIESARQGSLIPHKDCGGPGLLCLRHDSERSVAQITSQRF